MRRVLLIFLSLVLALVGWSTVCAEDGFYVIPTMKGNYAPVPKTGQTTSYGTGDDGALQKGVAWPTPRFTDNSNGTVTDNLTRLIWMKNANAFGTENLGRRPDRRQQSEVWRWLASRTAPRRVTGACPTSGNSRAWSIMADMIPPCRRTTRSQMCRSVRLLVVNYLRRQHHLRLVREFLRRLRGQRRQERLPTMCGVYEAVHDAG